MQPERKPNPLAPPKRNAEPHPMAMHAAMWQHVNQMPQDDLTKAVDLNSYTVPIIGALAANPKVTARDVIKAAANAAADGKVTADKATQFISQMPDDPKALRPWLRNLYATNLTALVHMKAAMMRNGQGAQPGAPAQAPVAPPQVAA